MKGRLFFCFSIFLSLYYSTFTVPHIHPLPALHAGTSITIIIKQHAFAQVVCMNPAQVAALYTHPNSNDCNRVYDLTCLTVRENFYGCKPTALEKNKRIFFV